MKRTVKILALMLGLGFLFSACLTKSGLMAVKPQPSVKSQTALRPTTPGAVTAAPAAKPLTFAFCKKQSKSFYQAYLTSAWDSSAFKYISIDGLRYSRGIIMSHVDGANSDTIFFLKKSGELGVELNEHFDLEIDFYPPSADKHEEFKPFKVVVVNRDNKIIDSGEVVGRMKKFRLNR
ncbi:MAG: hypothetical protein JXR89_04150 [Deltaproteobacteria bacterium]|nr:hypothetical protein [Deltaproteobacteria bacterium]